jgi:hypothetical protein
MKVELGEPAEPPSCPTGNTQVRPLTHTTIDNRTAPPGAGEPVCPLPHHAAPARTTNASGVL